MITTLDASDLRFLASVNQIQYNAEQAQQQISSGLRLQSPSDDPADVSASILASAELNQTEQVQTNLGRATSEANTAEQALENATSVLQDVNTLGTQGLSGTQAPAQLSTLSASVQADLQQLVAASNSTVEGRYVFSGDDYMVAPYSLDPTQANGVSAYAGSAATSQIMDANGATFPISESGDEIFDNASPGASVFAAVNALQAALANVPTAAQGDPAYNAQYTAQQTAIQAAMAQVGTAQTQLSGVLSFYGTVQDRLQTATTTANQLQVTQQTDESNVQDADATQAALNLSMANTHLEAAMSARAERSNKSLFDYMA
ncbi:MAG: flagellin [Bryobacteraceae bacterium]